MKINSRNFKSKLDKCDQRSEGCDYLQLSVKEELDFEGFFELLDNDNSSIAHIEWENHVYTLSIDFSKKHRSILISVAVEDISFPIMKISQFNKWGWCISTMYSIHVLWTAFRLIEIWSITCLDDMISDVFIDDIEAVTSANITRIDYKFDLFYKNKTMIPKHKTLIEARKWTSRSKYSMDKEDLAIHQETIDTIMNWWEITYHQTREDYDDETCNWWSIWKRNTKTLRVRCYEKLIDCVAKGKFWLYDDYFQFQSVYRLEWEFRNYFCKNEDWLFYKLKDLESLIDKCRGRFSVWKHKSSYLYYPKGLSMKSSESIKRYVKSFQNRWYNLYENNMNATHLHIEWLLERGVDPLMLATLVDEERIWLDSVLSFKTGYR